MPPTLPPSPLANRTIGEATSLSPGLFHSHHEFSSHGQGATSSWDLRRLLARAGAAWQERDAPGRRLGDTDTSEARQTIRLNSIRSVGVWKTIRWHLACFVSPHSSSIINQQLLPGGLYQGRRQRMRSHFVRPCLRRCWDSGLAASTGGTRSRPRQSIIKSKAEPSCLVVSGAAPGRAQLAGGCCKVVPHWPRRGSPLEC